MTHWQLYCAERIAQRELRNTIASVSSALDLLFRLTHFFKQQLQA